MVYFSFSYHFTNVKFKMGDKNKLNIKTGFLRALAIVGALGTFCSSTINTKIKSFADKLIDN